MATLTAEGSPQAMSAAAIIQKAVDTNRYWVGLDREQRDSILVALQDDPPEGLAALHAVLARDHADRNYWN